ncbi:MAG: PQQ-dependent sugar dehydrogenase [Rhodothermales bacterium]
MTRLQLMTTFVVPAFLFLCLCARVPTVSAQPVALHPGVELEATSNTLIGVRLAFDASSGHLLTASLNGDIHAVHPDTDQMDVTLLNTTADHGTPTPVMGMAVTSDGTIFLVGNDANTHAGYNVGVIRRGRVGLDGNRTWETVATTTPYPRSGTNYDHNMNAVTVGPNGQFLYVNSGSRTDHGEEQSNNGQFPGIREVPLTSAILRIPIDATDVVLPDDEASLIQNGYLFADGFRNTFSMAFNAEGRLFGVENSGDRDDSEEMNEIVEGGHYGFPWRISLTDTPMQFPGYNPSTDVLLNPEAGAVQSGFFYNDPDYPAPPAGVTFTDPIVNVGPDADLYRDPETGAILDASDSGVTMATFTSHRSPLGLVFDTGDALPDPFTGNALALGWTGTESPLLAPFEGEGEDLLHLSFVAGSDASAIRTERIAAGFLNPIDAVLVDGRLYVLEFAGAGRIWQVSFAADTAVDAAIPLEPALLNVYPNPVSDRLTVNYTSERTGPVTAVVYGVDGRRVGVVRQASVVAGVEWRLAWDVAGLAAGVYVVVVESPGHAPARKVFVRLPR